MGESYRRSPTANNTCPNCEHSGYVGIFQKSNFGCKYICPNCGNKAHSEEF